MAAFFFPGEVMSNADPLQPVRDDLRDLKREFRELREALINSRIDIAVLKTKMMFIAAASGAIVSAIVNVAGRVFF